MSKDESQSEKIRKKIDEYASGEEFVQYKDISSENTELVKTLVSRELHDKLEYKNGKDATHGFRFKPECRHYFRKRKEDKIICNTRGDERKLFLTGGLGMLLDHETIENTQIQFECINELKNLDLVKKIATKYLGRCVISFYYQKGYQDKFKIVMHPHLLKEYNSRWFLFGYIEEQDKSLKIGNCALDRFVNKEIESLGPQDFKPAPPTFYNSYFEDIVGVTKIDENEKPQHLRIRTTDFKVHKLILTKPLHHSQKSLEPFSEEKGFGEFSINVIPNMELQTRLLSYGSGVYVVGEGPFQAQMRKEVEKMAALYKK
ncbi:MAG: WYL domain-containing protein [Bacteroidaceae bacterium]|nr:WYL domain-containing protein [Bacteroidaceae bacterium]